VNSAKELSLLADKDSNCFSFGGIFIKKMTFVSIVPALIIGINMPAQASNKVYQAGLTDSVWYLSDSTPIQCRLAHSIQKYGEAYFNVHANRKINLDFFLQSRRATPQTTFARLMSVPPLGARASRHLELQQLNFIRSLMVMLHERVRGKCLVSLSLDNNQLFILKMCL